MSTTIANPHSILESFDDWFHFEEWRQFGPWALCCLLNGALVLIEVRPSREVGKPLTCVVCGSTEFRREPGWIWCSDCGGFAVDSSQVDVDHDGNYRPVFSIRPRRKGDQSC